jgi:hypothetical protein
MTDYSEVMDFSVEHGYRRLRILAGNEEPVCQFKLSHQGFGDLPSDQLEAGAKIVFTLLWQDKWGGKDFQVEIDTALSSVA